MKKEIISASEIERYSYCPLSWWLSRSGIDGTGYEIREGGLKHEKLEDDLQKIKEEVKESKKSEQGITEFAVVTIILAIVGIIILFGSIFKEVVDSVYLILWCQRVSRLRHIRGGRKKWTFCYLSTDSWG